MRAHQPLLGERAPQGGDQRRRPRRARRTGAAVGRGVVAHYDPMFSTCQRGGEATSCVWDCRRPGHDAIPCTRAGAVFGRYRIIESSVEAAWGWSSPACGRISTARSRQGARAGPSEDQSSGRGSHARRARSEVDSPHIIHIYEHGEQDGCLFIATPLVNGGDLRNLLEEHGGLPALRAIEIVAQVAPPWPTPTLPVSSTATSSQPTCCSAVGRPRGSPTCATSGSRQTDDEQRPDRWASSGPRLPRPRAPRGLAERPSPRTSTPWAACCGHADRRAAVRRHGRQVAMQHLRGTVPVLPGIGQLQLSVSAIVRRAMAKAPEERYPSQARCGPTCCLPWRTPRSLVARRADDPERRPRVRLGDRPADPAGCAHW